VDWYRHERLRKENIEWFWGYSQLFWLFGLAAGMSCQSEGRFFLRSRVFFKERHSYREVLWRTFVIESEGFLESYSRKCLLSKVERFQSEYSTGFITDIVKGSQWKVFTVHIVAASCLAVESFRYSIWDCSFILWMRVLVSRKILLGDNAILSHTRKAYFTWVHRCQSSFFPGVSTKLVHYCRNFIAKFPGCESFW